MSLEFKKYAKKLSEFVDGDLKWTVGKEIIYCMGPKGEISITKEILSLFEEQVSKRTEKLIKKLRSKSIDSKIKRENNREFKELRRCKVLLDKNKVAGKRRSDDNEDKI